MAVRIVPQLLLLVYYNVVEVQRIWLERRWGFGLKWGIGDIRIWKFFGISNSTAQFLLLKRKSTEEKRSSKSLKIDKTKFTTTPKIEIGDSVDSS